MIRHSSPQPEPFPGPGAVTGARVADALEAEGFQVLRRRAGHLFLQHPDGRTTIVPVHREEALGPGILLQIALDTGLSRRALLLLLGAPIIPSRGGEESPPPLF